MRPCLSALALLTLAPTAHANALGTPPAGSTVSGVGVISGYHCSSKSIEIRIDGTSLGLAGAGTTLLGTAGVCGRTDTGFSLLYNFNNLNNGAHTVAAYADGVLFASQDFTTVKSAGTNWLTDASKSITVADFPSSGLAATLEWAQTYQNFVVTSLSSIDPGTAPRAISLSPAASVGNFGTPADASTVSGVGVISGYHCTSKNIEVRIDGTSLGPAGAGTTLQGTAGVCGRTDTGFSLLYNFNNLSNGLHQISIYADGALFDQHEVRTVQSGNSAWLAGASKSVSVADFPAAGNQMQLDWVQSYQAFLTTSFSASPNAPRNVSVSHTGMRSAGSDTVGSSSKLLVSWAAPASGTVDHYVVTATEGLMNTSVSISAAAASTSATLTPLKAATAYSVVVKACLNSSCTDAGSAAAVSATTPNEYWQLQGSGNTVAGLTPPVADGNARLSATRFGAEAGAVANTVQFYYGPAGVSGQSVATSQVVAESQPASYLSGFTSYARTSGLRSPTDIASSASRGIKSVMTGQGVPLSAAMGAKVRLFFESNDADGKTRIYSVDSVDGYVGRDFNQGSATTCSTVADYSTGGSCPTTVVLGVEGDATNPTNKISAARQNKVAWPTLTDWRWNGEIGTFLVFTIDRISGCTTAPTNHGYALWDGSRFVPQYESNGCPKAFKSAQAALPVHIGDVRYKMYFGDVSNQTGRISSSGLPFLGPKQMIYADGRSSGDAGIVEFEDWESVGNSRDVVFLWPNGDRLDAAAEGYIDDFHFLTPTGNLELQVLYLSITDGTVAPFAATAVLLNP